jgi:hypothetical protein
MKDRRRVDADSCRSGVNVEQGMLRWSPCSRLRRRAIPTARAATRTFMCDRVHFNVNCELTAL